MSSFVYSVVLIYYLGYIGDFFHLIKLYYDDGFKSVFVEFYVCIIITKPCKQCKTGHMTRNMRFIRCTTTCNYQQCYRVLLKINEKPLVPLDKYV